MPTVFRESGFEFRIYLDDHEPAHVHAVKAGDEAVINIGNESSRPSVRENYGLNKRNLRKALLIVAENQPLFFRSGDEYMAKARMGRWEYTEEELDRMFDEATIRGKLAATVEPQARSVHFDPATNRVVVELKNGATFIFPCQFVQGLSGASAHDIAGVKLGPRGASLHWEKMDLDFSIVGLMSGVFGNKAWMKSLARAGGRGKREPAVARGAYAGNPVNPEQKRTSKRAKSSRAGTQRP